MSLKTKYVEIKNLKDQAEISKAKETLGAKNVLLIPVGTTAGGGDKIERNFVVPALGADDLRKNIDDSELDKAYYGENYSVLLSKVRAEAMGDKPSGGRSRRNVL
jgi:5-formaminoimidazole-4-carboxamide-1-beta-D-ribofuranosyl 5'-monophosphate synthetase